MATCDVCGGWAGLFRKRHPQCVQAHDPEDLAMKIALAIKQSMVQEASASAEISIRFGTEFASAFTPESEQRALSLIEMVLMRAQIRESDAIESISKKVLSLAVEGAGSQALIRWCRSNESPACVRSLDKRWCDLLSWCGWCILYSSRDRRQLSFDGACDVFPFFALSADGCRIANHQMLDGFAALRDDPIWEIISPPSDWLCTCKLLALMKSEPEISSDAREPGIGRIPPDLIRSMVGWEKRAPTKALRILSI